MKNRKLAKAAQIVIRDCLAVKPKEKVVIVTDDLCYEVGYAIREELRSITDPILINILPRKIHGEEPPPLVAQAIKDCDVFIMPTSRSLTHTKARIEANKNGARGATLPGITVEVMERSLCADYRQIALLTKKMTRLLSQAKKALIRTKLGTDLTLDLTLRRGFPDTGTITKPGAFSNLPGGEAYIAPIERKSKGTIVVDGSFAPIGFLHEPVILEIKNGELIKINGNKKIREIFGRYGKHERTLCEFGIGTNKQAKITGNVLEDEKVLGSIHVAFGNNLGFGGQNRARIHLDAVITKPSVWLDNRMIIASGKLLI